MFTVQEWPHKHTWRRATVSSKQAVETEGADVQKSKPDNITGGSILNKKNKTKYKTTLLSNANDHGLPTVGCCDSLSFSHMILIWILNDKY